MKLIRSDRLCLLIAESYTASMINRTRRRDIGSFTVRTPETVRVEFTPEQKEIHDRILDIQAKILGRIHGNQYLKFMMTTIDSVYASENRDAALITPVHPLALQAAQFNGEHQAVYTVIRIKDPKIPADYFSKIPEIGLTDISNLFDLNYRIC